MNAQQLIALAVEVAAGLALFGFTIHHACAIGDVDPPVRRRGWIRRVWRAWRYRPRHIVSKMHGAARPVQLYLGAGGDLVLVHAGEAPV